MGGSHLQFLLLLGLLSYGFSLNLLDYDVRCKEEESQALLQFKQHLVDDSHMLSSWDSHEDCCKWNGIRCSNKTGRVVKVDLRADLSAEPLPKYVAGEISSSLLGLQYLTYLDLSFNDFPGEPFPNFVGSLTKLRYLNLSRTYIAGTIPQQLGNLSGLISLDLSGNMDLIELHNLDWLIHLSSLRHLDMSFVNLSQVLNWQNKVSMLPTLTDLSLSSCSLSTTIPPFLSNANSSSQLLFLDLSFNDYLNCSIFPWLFNSTTSLVGLDLSYSGLRCSIPDTFGCMDSLRSLDLDSNSFDGGIPKSIWNLCNLNSLSLTNNSLSGHLDNGFMINVSGCMGSSLKVLQLDENTFTGPLPESIRNFSNLEILNLQQNKFTGPLPKSIGNLYNLKALRLQQNNFTGPLPESIGNLSNLEVLNAADNSLEGVISEVHFSNLFKLRKLYLGSNSLNLSFNYDWVPPFQLDIMLLSSCTMGPTFPKWLRSQKNLSRLDISHAQISDSVPAWFWDFTPGLESLCLSHNKLHGELPDLSSSRQGIFGRIDLSSNIFEGSIPHFNSNVTFLDLSNNRFSGPISFLCDSGVISLTSLILSNNTLSGELPDCWMYFQELAILDLANNNFYGKIPSSMGSLVSVQFLHLSNNRFVGNFPLSLQNCSQLKTIHVGENNLSGKIPSWLGDSLPDLVILILRSNQFYGSFPLNLCHLSNIRLLDLSLNKIEGTIPECINNLTAMSQKESSGLIDYYGFLTYFMDHASFVWKGKESVFQTSLLLAKIIDLSNNLLHGEVPEGITSLMELVALNLSRNHLTGLITPKIGLLQHLESLDLSRNQLHGEIPASLSDISFLNYLDLSNNNLSGRIPTGTQLQSFNASAFIGNRPELCGPPLPNECPGDFHPDYTNSTRAHKTDDIQTNDHEDGFISQGFFVATSLGFIVGFWGVCCTLLLNLKYIKIDASRFQCSSDVKIYKLCMTVTLCMRMLQSWIKKLYGIH
ncbi:receptor-like protein EIX2 isoform X2 [Juglans regia]|uniref:Receptor-like protein EIX2 isoform X2 n=1 Tax=Juglans regia TaxID=51240 RepID=A0A2I4DG67_JUGRE|nr:receptor-like protein EIX2 isoform X2 [Juglans regia]